MKLSHPFALVVFFAECIKYQSLEWQAAGGGVAIRPNILRV